MQDRIILFIFILLNFYSLSHSSLRDSIPDRCYEARHEYHYRYDAQISTGISEVSKQNAIIRLQALVSVAFLRHPNEGVLYLSQNRIAKLNRDIPDPRVLQPFAAFEVEKFDREQQRVMQLPVRFKYFDGMISELEFDRDEQFWAANIKRAVLNMFQVNMKRHITGNELSEKFLSKKMSSTETTFFAVNETTLEGNCETVYSREKGEKFTKVTKSINFEKCDERFGIDLDYHFLRRFPRTLEDKVSDESTLKSVTLFHYIVREDEQGFLIDRVDVDSKYTFTPFIGETTAITTFAIGKLTLLKVLDKPGTVIEPRSDFKRSLLYDPSQYTQIMKFYINGDRSPSEFFTSFAHKLQIIEDIIGQMVRSMNVRWRDISPDATHQMARLVDVLRMCSMSELREVMNIPSKFDLVVREVNDILLDALAIAGTNNTVSVVVDKILSLQLNKFKKIHLLHLLMNPQVVSDNVVINVRKLSKTSDKDVGSTALLATAALIHKLCSEDKGARLGARNNRQCAFRMDAVKELASNFDNAQNRDEKLLALKAIGNAGLIELFDKLEIIITEKNEESELRVAAIDSLRRLDRRYPERIQTLLMPVFGEYSEAAEVRMAALAEIMHTLPSRAVIDHIAHILIHDSNQQVQAFTLSALMSFANSRNPNEKEMAANIRNVLPLVRHQQRILNAANSRFWHLPYMSDGFSFSGSVDVITMIANESSLPRQTVLNIESFLHTIKSSVQFGFIQYNGEQLIENFLRIKGAETWTEYLGRDPRSVSISMTTELLRSIHNSLKTSARYGIKGDVRASFYFRLDNVDYLIIPVNERTIPDYSRIIKNDRIDFSQLDETLRNGIRYKHWFLGFAYEAEQKIATTVGLPLTIGGKAPYFNKFDIALNGAFSPRSGKRLDEVKVNFDFNSNLIGTNVFTMAVWHPVCKAGIKGTRSVQMNIPLKGEIHLSLHRTPQLRLDFTLPNEKIQIFTVHTRLVTFTGKFDSPRRMKKWPVANQTTMYNDDERRMHRIWERTLGEKAFGYNIQIHSQYHSDAPKWMSDFACENLLEVFLQPRGGAAQKLSFQIGAENVKHAKMDEIDIGDFYTNEDDAIYFERDVVNEKHNVRAEERTRMEQFLQNINEQKNEEVDQQRLQLSIIALRSQRSEKIAEAIVVTACSFNTRYCSLDANLNRKPFLDEEDVEWTLGLKAQYLYPKEANSIREFMTLSHREFNSIIKAEWGASRKQRLTMKTQGEQSESQMICASKLGDDIQLAEDVRMKGGLTPVERLDEIIRCSLLNQYRISVDSSFATNLAIINFLRAHMPSNAHVTYRYNPGYKIFAKITIDPRTYEHASVWLRSPHEDVTIDKIPLPAGIDQLMLSVHQHISRNHSWIGTLTSEKNAECLATSKYINMFNNVQIKVPFIGCYSVLVKDCSSRPRFAVLIKSVSRTSEDKASSIS
ncbi:hypothetical protein AB6A40_004327 [Gnathostoma spinigerum]|uniref:Vitellogenin domain-containing protein n=1 Tax=Gnathostoma spinigerum TaxID=75299 RepID=A0ABD6EC60_9BILA